MKASLATYRRAWSRTLLFLSLLALWCWQSALAQGATGPPGLEGLPYLLIMLTVYPYVGIALSYLLFRAFGRVWFFWLAPLFFVGLCFLAPVDSASPDPQMPPIFSGPGAWFYWPHVAGILISYYMWTKTEKTWLFFLAPPLAWAIQIGSLLIMLIAD